MKKSITRFIGMMKSQKFLHYFTLYSLIFVLSFVISTIAGMKIKSLSDGAVFFVDNFTSLRNGDDSMMSILLNNFLIAILFSYYFYVSKQDKFKKFIGVQYFIYIGVLGGLLVSKVAMKYNMILALSLVVPHGIIEIPAIIYAASSGWALSDLRKSYGWKIPIEFVYSCIILFIMFSISAYIESNITLGIYSRLQN